MMPEYPLSLIRFFLFGDTDDCKNYFYNFLVTGFRKGSNVLIFIAKNPTSFTNTWLEDVRRGCSSLKKFSALKLENTNIIHHKSKTDH